MRHPDGRERDRDPQRTERADDAHEQREPPAARPLPQHRQAAHQRPRRAEPQQHDAPGQRQAGAERERDRHHPPLPARDEDRDRDQGARPGDLEHEDRHVGDRDLQRPRGAARLRQPREQPDPHRHRRVRLHDADEERPGVRAVDRPARRDAALDGGQRHAPGLRARDERGEVQDDEQREHRHRDGRERGAELVGASDAHGREDRERSRHQHSRHGPAQAHAPRFVVVRDDPVNRV